MMTQHILVAYASRAGSTAEVAQAIGQILREVGAEVDVCSVERVRSVAGYDALVLGSAIWAGRPLPEALRFAASQRRALAELPVAYFALCEILRVDTPANRDRARGFLAPLREIREPVALEAFAGKKDYSSVHPFVRWLMIHVLHSPEGDWRDWDKIRAWAAGLPLRLARAERRRAPSASSVARRLAAAGGRH
jgi:menaquinone-dependent protoporphyrinogen oxidase